MAVITYSTFRTRLRESIWPPGARGEPASLRDAHNTMLQEAMYEVAKWVRSLKLSNVTIVAGCATYVKNGVTMLEAPYGRYNRVYAIVAGRHDDPIYYNQVSYDEILRWSNEIQPYWIEPPNSTPALELGFRYTSDVADSLVGRARLNPVYALYQKRLYLAPWIQHYEEVVIDWNGEKRSWADADTLDETYWNQDVEQAIKAWVKWRHECDFGCGDRQTRMMLRAEFDEFLREAIYQDDEKHKLNPNPDPDLIQRPMSYYEAIDELY